MRAVGCCLLLILGGSQGLRVHFGFTLEPDDYVTFIQDFGAESGQYEVSLDVSADGCDGSSNASSGECAWAGTEGLYLLVLTADQRQQLRDRITEARSSLTGKAECFQLAAAQMELNVQRWIESRSPNRSDAIPAPAIGSALNFSTAGSFPERIERYTLAAFHCKRERTVRIRIEGNAHFLGKGGELLSIPERTELNVLGALLVLATIATLALAYFSVRRRGELVPLQLLLFGTLCINDLQLLSQLTPILQRARNDALVVPAYASSGLYYISAHMVIAHLLYLVGFVSTCAAMLALAAGRRFATGPLFRGEGEMCVGIVAIYAIFGLLQLECGNELTCGVVVLSFQTMRIVIIFGIFFFLNFTCERLSRAGGHGWPSLGHQLLRLQLLRRLRNVLMLCSLALPILFMFLEVRIFPWHTGWFTVLWREILNLYLLGHLIFALFPSEHTRATHFTPLSPQRGGWIEGTYPQFFRWLLGMSAPRRPHQQ